MGSLRAWFGRWQACRNLRGIRSAEALAAIAQMHMSHLSSPANVSYSPNTTCCHILNAFTEFGQGHQSFSVR